MTDTEKFTAVLTDVDGKKEEAPLSVTCSDGGYTVVVKREALVGKKCDCLRVESPLTRVQAPREGEIVFPTDFTYGVVACTLDKKEDAVYRSVPSAMPVAAICGNADAVTVLVKGCDADARFCVQSRGGVYELCPEIVLDGDDPDEDIVISYTKMPNATYCDVAKAYRDYQIREKGCVPLKTRTKEREKLKRAIDSVELRIRMGWKPQPTPVRRQTVENEPPMKIACDIPTLNKLIDKMKGSGVEDVEICLVGWGAGGHDGRFPQHYPCDERFGGDAALKDFIKRANGYGYTVTCHSNSKGAYEIADNWDEKKLTCRPDKTGEVKPWIREDYAETGLQGGEPYHVCAKHAYESYAVKDFPVIRAYGFEGMHYVDELSACEPVKCYAPEHPTSRREVIEYYRKIARLSSELFGGCQSEAWFDFLNADLDYVLYTSVQTDVTRSDHPLFDRTVPFFAITYHGIVASNATSATVNYPIKGNYEALKVIEQGSRPLLYINSMFEGRDWMGKVDLYVSSDEELERSVRAIKKAQDDYRPLRHLQYELIENHEQLAPGVVRVTYSDGTVITVDYNKESFLVEHA